MEILNIEGTDDTPRIILDKGNGIFEISGRSLPEDTAEFFKPVLEWLENYKKEPNATTEFVVKLAYSNTSSSKLILDILLSIQDIKALKIIWYYQEDDEDMEDAGRELSEQVGAPFEFKIY